MVCGESNKRCKVPWDFRVEKGHFQRKSGACRTGLQKDLQQLCLECDRQRRRRTSRRRRHPGAWKDISQDSRVEKCSSFIEEMTRTAACWDFLCMPRTTYWVGQKLRNVLLTMIKQQHNHIALFKSNQLMSTTKPLVTLIVHGVHALQWEVHSQHDPNTT